MIDWLYKGKPSLVGACVGAIAGLVGITPCAGYVQPWAAIVIGFITTVFCQVICEIRRIWLARWLDDALDVWGTHGCGGFIGGILVGVLSDPFICSGSAVDDQGNSISPPSWCVFPMSVTRSGTQFGKQIAAVLICAVWSVTVTIIILKLIGLVVQLRPSNHEEGKSVDEHEHGELAYHSPTKIFTEA